MVVIVLALAYVLLDWMRVDEREARRADVASVLHNTSSG